MEQALAEIHQGSRHRTPIIWGLETVDGKSMLTFDCEPICRLGIARALHSQYPDAQVEPIADASRTLSAGDDVWTADLRLEPGFFPIRRYTQFEDVKAESIADPIAALLAAVESVRGEGLTARIEIRVIPARSRGIQRARAALERLAGPAMQGHPRLAEVYAHLAFSSRFALRFLGFLVSRLVAPDASATHLRELAQSPSRTHEREGDVQATSDKLHRLLFEARVRLIVRGSRNLDSQARARLHELAAAFGQYHAPRLAAFRMGPIGHMKRHEPWNRRPTFLLSAEELATLWHPPLSTVKTPTLASVPSRDFPPPTDLPVPTSHRDLALLGETSFRGGRQRFGILLDDRRRHMALLGKTGMGKSTLMLKLLASDIASGRGAMLLDPHGDLAEAALRTIPQRRTNDVVVFDAGDTEHPLAFNVLSCPEPSQRPLLVSGIVSAFKKLFAHSWGPRLEHILRHSLLALTEVPGTSLLTIVRLLSDRHYRQGLVARVADPVVRHFWEREFTALPLRLQIESVAPIQNKVGQFLASPILRNILGQSKTTLDLRRIMDERRVLIVNLSKGRVGEDASSLLGSLLVTTVQLAAMSRADRAEHARPDFSLFVDEFQNVATESFSTILSEARKYRVNLTLANQYLEQIDEPTLAAIFGNVGTVVAFQIGARDAEIVAAQLGGDIVPADLMSLPRYQAYIRLLIDGQSSRPFSMRTLPPPVPADVRQRDTVRQVSQRRHSRARPAVEAEIAATLRT